MEGERRDREMVSPMVLLRNSAQWLFTCDKAARKLIIEINNGFLLHWSSSKLHQPHPSLCPDLAKCPLDGREGQSLASDFEGAILRSLNFFPYFMLVAFEGGSLIRALLLLLLWPLLWLLGPQSETSLRVMTFIAFCGLRTRDMDIVARAVLPKFYMEDLHQQAYEILASSTGKRVVFTNMPRLMAERFLKDYLAVSHAVGAELQVAGDFFTGLISGSSSSSAAKQKALRDLFGEEMADVSIVHASNPHDHLFSAHSKEIYVVNKDKKISVLPRDKYPKPLIFHDGRLAMRPTPLAALSLYVWMPFGMIMCILRIFFGLVLPYRVAYFLGAVFGVRFRVAGLKNTNIRSDRGVLYVCNHRTLLDPVMLSATVNHNVPAVTYSLSRMSEMLSPIKTVRLTRDRDQDAASMRKLLSHGDLALCPEGTTCREPYLLRFSSLFAELVDEMIPVALVVRMSMLYATTASGRKWLDPVVFFLDPTPEYRVEILELVAPDKTCAGGRQAAEVANLIQKQLGDALGFECTSLTRRDKYLMLAGNKGTVGGRFDDRKAGSTSPF